MNRLTGSPSASTAGRDRSLGTSNEPLIVQALEEAILFRQWCADGNPEPTRSEDLAHIREYRKLLQRARSKTMEKRRPHESEVYSDCNDRAQRSLCPR